MAEEFTFNIEQKLGIIAEGKGGWNMELNLVSWSGRPAKYDIRSWSQEHDKMGKGITLSKEELVALRSLLDKVNLD